MSQVEMPAAPVASSRAIPEPLPAEIKSAQPGGGFCYRVELAWGKWRRWFLKTFNRGYVRRMRELRRGDPAGCPHEILDPRDLKFCRNQTDCHWDLADDPFAWRDRIPFARWGLAELQIMGWPLLAATVGLAFTYWYLAPITAIPLALVVWFFRDPPRSVPQDAILLEPIRKPPEERGTVPFCSEDSTKGDSPRRFSDRLLVSPADGKVVEVTPLEHDDFIGGPAVRIAIFLSLFNVHINRSPSAARVIRLRYSPGQFISALNPDCAIHNEFMWIGLEEEAPPHRKLAMRQVAGQVARRIVCDLRPGQMVERGEKFGMIKLGSRTELILPAEGLQIDVRVGQHVRGGCDVLARY